MDAPLVAPARRRSPLAALRHYARPAIALVVLGAIVGTGYALSRGNEYTAQARVAVSGVGLNPNNIPGFSNAAPELAADYARYVDTSDNAPILITALGANAASKVHSITASPIPQSTVIAIEVTASTSDVAIRATNAIASNLVKQVAQTQQATSPETTLEQYQKMTTQLAAAQTDVTKAQNELTAQQNAHASSSAIQSARDALTAAQTTAQTLQVQQQALALKYQDQVANPDIGGLLNQVTQASVIRNDLRSRVARYGLVGVAIGLALGVAAAVLLDRRAHQRHTADLEQAPADQEPDEDARELSPGTAGTRGDTPVRGAAAEKNGNRAVAELDEADRAPLATWVAPDDELLEADLDDHESRARVGADDVEHSDDTEPTDDTEPRKDERPKDDGRKDEPRKATAKSTGNGTDPKRDGHPAGARSPAGRNVVVKSAPVGTHAQDEWQ